MFCFVYFRCIYVLSVTLRSLATDNCAMWLNGFNDNVPGYPVVKCQRVECPPPYMGYEQPGE